MTVGEAAIFWALIAAIIAFLYKAIRETTNADSFRKILNQLSVVQQIHANKLIHAQDEHLTLKNRVDNHDEDFTNVRQQIREIGSPT